jgi:hypothetical protein
MNSLPFKTIEGKKEVLLSAPHVYAHRRPRLSMAYKTGEPLTDTILEEVCKNSNSFGIVLTTESDFDPNYHKEQRNPYKQEIRKIIKENKIKYFIDIHGLKDGHMYDIAVYYPTQFRKSIILSKLLQRNLERGELRGLNIAIFRFPNRLGETLGEFGASTLRVPSVQIEVARYIRESTKLRNEFVKNLSEVISKELI